MMLTAKLMLKMPQYHKLPLVYYNSVRKTVILANYGTWSMTEMFLFGKYF